MAFVKWIDRLNQVLSYLLCITLGMMTILVFLQVLVRFLFTEFSIPWSEEIARYLMIWLIFLGAGVATRKARLISIDTLVQILPNFVGQALKYAGHIITIIFLIAIFIIGIKWAEFGMSELSPATKTPKIYVYLAMSTGAFIMIINLITLLIETILNKTDIRDASLTEEKEAITELREGS